MLSLSPNFWSALFLMLDDSKILSHLVIPVGATISFIVLTKYFKSRGSLKESGLLYPPGPKGLPLIGKMLDFPHDMQVWEGFAQMTEMYRTSIILAFLVNSLSTSHVDTDIMYLNMS